MIRPEITVPVIMRPRRGFTGRVIRNAVAKTCSARRIFTPNSMWYFGVWPGLVSRLYVPEKIRPAIAASTIGRYAAAALASTASRASGASATSEGISTKRPYRIPPMSEAINEIWTHRMSTISTSPISVEYTIVHVIHEILPVGLLQCNCSIFGEEQTREALVVDPGDDIARVLELIRKHGLTVKAIVITHAHIDHIGGAQKLKQATGAPVYMNRNDTELQKMLDEQAAWLGMPPPEQVEIDAGAR